MSTASQQPNGVVINTKFITNAVGIITIVATMFTVLNKVNSYEYRLDKIEYSNSIKNDEIKVLTAELKSLNVKLADLTIELREMRASQRAIDEAKKFNPIR